MTSNENIAVSSKKKRKRKQTANVTKNIINEWEKARKLA